MIFRRSPGHFQPDGAAEAETENRNHMDFIVTLA